MSLYHGYFAVNGVDPDGQSWLALGWSAAAVEPTPAGEIVMGVITIAYGVWSLYDWITTTGEAVKVRDLKNDKKKSNKKPKDNQNNVGHGPQGTGKFNGKKKEKHQKRRAGTDKKRNSPDWKNKSECDF